LRSRWTIPSRGGGETSRDLHGDIDGGAGAPDALAKKLVAKRLTLKQFEYDKGVCGVYAEVEDRDDVRVGQKNRRRACSKCRPA